MEVIRTEDLTPGGIKRIPSLLDSEAFSTNRNSAPNTHGSNDAERRIGTAISAGVGSLVAGKAYEVTELHMDEPSEIRSLDKEDTVNG